MIMMMGKVVFVNFRRKSTLHFKFLSERLCKDRTFWLPLAAGMSFVQLLRERHALRSKLIELTERASPSSGI